MTREDAEQGALIQWARLCPLHDGRVSDWLVAIPNGGYRCRKTAGILKATGVKRGVSDLFLAWPTKNHAGLWIELKAPKTTTKQAGRPTAEQLVWLDRMARVGYMSALCVGWESARDTISGYIKGEPWLDQNSALIQVKPAPSAGENTAG